MPEAEIKLFEVTKELRQDKDWHCLAGSLVTRSPVHSILHGLLYIVATKHWSPTLYYNEKGPTSSLVYHQPMTAYDNVSTFSFTNTDTLSRQEDDQE